MSEEYRINASIDDAKEEFGQFFPKEEPDQVGTVEAKEGQAHEGEAQVAQGGGEQDFRGLQQPFLRALPQGQEHPGQNQQQKTGQGTKTDFVDLHNDGMAQVA